MKKAIFIAFLIAQASSMSLYDMFAPVEDRLGRLVSDVVTDIKDTIDCTILAVEHVFSLDGIFGRSSEYDQKCRGQNTNNDAQSDKSSSTTDDNDSVQETAEVKSPKGVLMQEIEESTSEASRRIQSILDKSNTQSKLEEVKKSIKNESDYLAQVSTLLSHEIQKLPDEVKKKFKFNLDQPSIDDILDEIKLMYEVEQRDKSSAEANEVRHTFDKVLNILHVNDIEGPMSDADEVKKIVMQLGKSTNESLVDVEKQVAKWTEEQNKQINVIESVVIIKNNITESAGSSEGDKKRSNNNILHSEKLDDITKTVVNKVSANTSSPLSTSMPSKSNDDRNMLISTQSPQEMEHSFVSTTGLPTAVETKVISNEPDLIIVSTKESSNTTETRNSFPTESLSADQTSAQKSSTEESCYSPELISDSTKSPSLTNERSTTVHSTNRLGKAIELSDETHNQETATTTPPVNGKNSIETYLSHQSDTQTNTSNIPLSLDTVINSSTIQSSLASSRSVETSQSNIHTVTSGTRSSEINTQEQQPEGYTATTQPPQPDVQSMSTTERTDTVSTTTTMAPPPIEIPKSFKDLFTKSPSDYQDYTDDEDNGSNEDYSNSNLSLINKLFGSLNKEKQQETVESAQSIIEESQRHAAIVNDFFESLDHSSAPSVFDDPDLFSF